MLRRVLRLGLAIDWGRVTPVLLLTALAAILPVGLPLLMGRAIDAALQGAGIVQVLPLLGWVVVIAMAGAAAELLANALGARVGYALSWQLARRLYAALLRMPLLSYFTINPGVLNSRLTNDMRLVDPLFATVPMATVHGWVGLAAVAVGLGLINLWFLAAFVLVPVAVLVVAHRLSAVERANHVVMLERGRIVERGTHAGLITGDGPYARMHRSKGAAD